MFTAVYSGSFNPLHIGHLAILNHLSENPEIDRILLIVSPKNPLKQGISSDSAAERFAAACEAVKRHELPKVEVCDIELGMPEPHYTIRTLDALRHGNPHECFSLVMGADQIADIKRWKDFGRILTEYGVLVYPRAGFDLQKTIKELQTENPGYKIGIINAPEVNVSSTMIREAISEGKDVSDFMM